jgi:putative oxidoreductase
LNGAAGEICKSGRGPCPRQDLNSTAHHKTGKVSKVRIIKEVVLWVMTVFLALVCLRSGWLKVSGNIFWVRDFHRWGYPDWFRLAVGVAELISLVLLLVPRLASYGASLFAVIMLGAIFTHYSHNETSRLPFNFLLLTLSLVIAFMRRPSFLKGSTKSRNG